MADTFLHGVEVVNIDDGPRPIQVVATSIIGICGTAPDADEATFPLNTPVLISGSKSTAAKLDMAGNGNGTLPDALDSILQQAGAVVVVVRVEEGETDDATLANVLGGVDANTGNYNGIQGFLASGSVLGFAPRILIAPGFTHQRVTGGVTVINFTAGDGYTDGTYTLDVTNGEGDTTGTGAAATATIKGGKVTAAAVTNNGMNYKVAPVFALPEAAGTPTTAATFTPAIGDAGNAVVANLLDIANRLRAVIVQDGANTTDAAVILQAGDFGSQRVYLVDPQVLKTSNVTGALEQSYSSAIVAGLIAYNDNTNGYWVSPSNKVVNGVQGTFRAIDFVNGDPSSRANILNSKNVATIIRQNGYRLWGNRTLSSDSKWQFLCVVRTADIINDSLQAACLQFADMGINKAFVTEVVESVNAFLRSQQTQGAILGGTCWCDPDQNSDEEIANGHVTFDFDFTPAFPAEHITMRSHLVNDYITSIFS
ncbi:phage tail sheath C-terminal domain-containing protein [Paraburkholderia sp. BR10936]|uniref:phage tail sheath C-terminal domain-containing protein n=1 Tax=Paraburkholderia sp. BR10936 TaxID=3236993 RepID=UPI0034D37EC0